MIIIETTKTKYITVRTNRRVKWEYAEYCGRYETVEEALEAVKEHYGDQPLEWLIKDLDTDEVTTGFMNWDRKPAKKKAV